MIHKQQIAGDQGVGLGIEHGQIVAGVRPWLRSQNQAAVTKIDHRFTFDGTGCCDRLGALKPGLGQPVQVITGFGGEITGVEMVGNKFRVFA